MRNHRVFVLVCCMCVATIAVAGCGKKNPEEVNKAKKVFEPGKLVLFNEVQNGFSILRPEHVTFAVSNNTVVSTAKGFPKITVTVYKTKENSTGSSSSGGMGKFTHKVYAPMRKLVCRCEDMGKHEALIRKICKSLKNTKAAPKKLSVKFDAPNVNGFPSGKINSEAAAAFRKALLAIKPRIVACWTKAVAADPKFPHGHLNFILNYNNDGSMKQSNITRTFNYPAHKPLTSCVKKLILPVTPKPQSGVAELRWYLRFNLY